MTPALGGLSAKANGLHLPRFRFGVFHLPGALSTKTIEPHQLIVETLRGVAFGLLALAKGATPDFGGRERPHYRDRVKPVLVLSQYPFSNLQFFRMVLSIIK